MGTLAFSSLIKSWVNHLICKRNNRKVGKINMAIWGTYSRVSNKRTGPNKRTGGKKCQIQ